MTAPYQPMDFGGLAAALLAVAHTVVPRWLPGGVERQGRWYVGDFDGSEGESANVSLVTGTWIDNAGGAEDRGGDLLSLYKRVFGHHTMLDAARAVQQEMGWEPVASGPPVRGAPPPPAAQTPAPASVPAPRPADRWRSVLPVPKHAPKVTRFRRGFKNDKTGDWVDLEAVRHWTWEFEGEHFGYTARFERVNSSGELEKDVLPFTWCEDTQDERGGARWQWKQWAAPRPLYVPLGMLGDARLVPVVVVEGEKKAEAGHALLGHEFDFVSWPGGCKAWALVRWSWLMGRTVYLWPDADAKRQALTRDEKARGVAPADKPFKPLNKQPGYQAMVGIGQLLQAEHGCEVFILPMLEPGARPDGWDLADAVEEGWDAARVRDYIRSAHAFVAPDDAARAATGTGGISTPSRAAAGKGQGAAEAADVAGADALWNWTRFLLRAEKTDAVKAVRENVVTALDGRPDKHVAGIADCAGLISFNEFTNNIEKRGATPWGTDAGEWQECDELLMGDWLVREHYMPSMQRTALVEAVQVVAARHRAHPLRDRMVALRGKWDRCKRLDTWLRRVCLEEDEYNDSDPLQQYLALAGSWFVMGMVARLLPRQVVRNQVRIGAGTKFDFMLVLESPQGWGKSTLAKLLMGEEYFADTGLDINNKDSLMNIQGMAVYEWSELENLNKQEVGAVKRFISSSSDRFRATFDKRPAKYPRQVVFVGTTNEVNYLTDTTGNRRFWPVRVTRAPDLEWLTENIEQMLAEAVERVELMERFWPTREEQRLLFDPQQSERTVESSLEGSIRALLYDEGQNVPHGKQNLALVEEIGMQALLDRAGFLIDKQTDAVVKKAGALMHMLGWEVRRTSKPGRPRVYVRPKATASTALPGASQGSTAASPGPGRETPRNPDPGSDDDPPF